MVEVTEIATHLACAIQSGKRVRIQALAHGKLVRDLEEGSEAEYFREVGTKAGKHVVVEEDIALDLSSDVLDCAWVRQAQLCSSIRKRCQSIRESGDDGVVAQKR